MSLQIRAEAQLELNKRHGERMKNYASQLEFYKQNPYRYAVERLGVKPESLDWTLFPEYKGHKWDGTVNPIMHALESLAQGYWVVIRSSVGVQKTFTAAIIALWFLDCWQENKNTDPESTGAYVITTAPKRDQLHSQIWSEISRLYGNFGKGKLLTGELRMGTEMDTKWKAEAFVAGTKASEDSTTKAQGFHAQHMLIIIEETPGVPIPTLNALINTSTGGHNMILALGNPNSRQDNFKEFNKIQNVRQIRISSYDHPNIVLNKEVIPGAQTTQGLQRLKDKYGENHPMYLSRARGITPDSAVDALIKAEWVDDAIKRYNELCDENGNPDMDKVTAYNILMGADNVNGLGVDVANSESGDEAAICEGKGYVCLNVESFPCPDSNRLGDTVHIRAKDKNVSDHDIGIDGIGVGAGTVNEMKKLGHSENEINIIAGSSPISIPDDEEIYLNLRSQMWWKAREDFRLGKAACPDIDELKADLLAPKYEIKSDKKIKVQSKVEIKKTLGRSTNHGDAYVMWNWKKHSTPPGYGETETEADTIQQNLISNQFKITT